MKIKFWKGLLIIFWIVFQNSYSTARATFEVEAYDKLPPYLRNKFESNSNLRILKKPSPDDPKKILYILFWINNQRLGSHVYSIDEKYVAKMEDPKKVLFNLNDLKQLESYDILKQKTIDFVVGLAYEGELLEHVNPGLLEGLLKENEFVAKFNHYMSARSHLNLFHSDQIDLAWQNLKIL